MRTKLWYLLAVFALAQSGGARAQLLFDITPSVEAGAPGTTLTFSGVLTNVGGSTVFLNGDTFLLFGAGVTLDDAKFLTNFPTALAPSGSAGSSASGELFDVIIDASASPGDYPGSFTILGGATGGSFATLASHDFLITVTPEPGPFSLLAAAGTVGLGLRLRRRGCRL